MNAPIFAYFRERMSPLLFAPIILLLALAAWYSAATITLSAFAHAIGLMALLVIQFRLWDDLADRERDRATHSNRVLVRAKIPPFQILAVALALSALTATWFLGGALPFAALVVLNSWFAILYAGVRDHFTPAFWQYPVLLAKYPAFVAIVASAVGELTPARALIPLLFVYCAALGFEALHSRRAPS